MIGKFVFSDSPRLTEQEYFKREFGLTIICDAFQLKAKKPLQFDDIVLIASGNPFFWHNTLMKLPPSSVIFFLLGNETYEPSIYNSLNNLSCIKHVFVYNPPTQIRPLHHWYSLIGDLCDQFPKMELHKIRGILRDNRTSRHLQSKFRSIQFRYSWSPLPQGYSNSFVSGLNVLNLLPLNHTDSLIEQRLVSDLQNMLHKERRFIFVGQRTNRRREQILSFLSKRTDAILVTKETGFGGTVFDGDSTYVDLLLSSWFNVIPPGYFNNSNHRYTESCIVGSIPVILYHNSIDHSDNNNWSGNLSALTAHSFKNLVKYLDSIDERDLQNLAKFIRDSDFEQIIKARDTLNQLLNY
jgi:hypothetical protein